MPQEGSGVRVLASRIKHSRFSPPARPKARNPRIQIRSGISHHPVEQRFAAVEALEVLKKMADQGFGLFKVSAGDVRGDEAIRLRPERVIIRQGLRIGHIQPGRPEAPGMQCRFQFFILTMQESGEPGAAEERLKAED